VKGDRKIGTFKSGGPNVMKALEILGCCKLWELGYYLEIQIDFFDKKLHVEYASPSHQCF
jgi:hypothetical protein